MRTLALVDFGIRAAPYFAALGAQLPEFRCVHFSLRPAVRSVLAQAGAELQPASARLRLPHSADPALLAEAGGKARLLFRDQALLARRVAALRVALAQFFDRCAVDAVLVWNGSGLVASVAAAEARRRGLPLLFGENGYLPGTLQLDPEGVNACASATRIIAAGADAPPDDPQAEARLDDALADFIAGRRPAVTPTPRKLKPAPMVRLARELRRLCDADSWTLPARLHRHGYVTRIAQLPPRYVFLPFQVAGDSQLLLHSPLVGGDMVRLLERVHGALRKVAPDTRLVVKLHPAERQRVQRGYRDLPARFPDVRFTTGHPTPELLQHCAAVVTVNSTVGFEGIVCGKPVLTLGHNFYTVPGLVEPVAQLDELLPALRRVLTEPIDAARRRRFLRYIHGRFLVPASYQDFSALSFAATAARVRALLEQARPQQS